ncbi:hypothetical protein BTA51_16665 [Hahella sp. CCB-MM4]|uniref:DUF5992 family protein n=1 Tax=Hahella sp. (strain CCB-MM4) TaxID=1926491 RepID=UPI000B9A9190|nr:DUF5992 family protein [Hahella sp. CCB-MM4]OZG72362.1 hypothetical protein BTA51_16665 [Hahella sp. CCB-MM4]
MFVTLFANAGDLATGSKIASITNTNSNSNAFVIRVEGGTGPCVGKSIVFPLSIAGSQSIFDKAYAAALAAFAGGFSIRVHNYSDDSCNQAAYIELSN